MGLPNDEVLATQQSMLRRTGAGILKNLISNVEFQALSATFAANLKSEDLGAIFQFELR